MRVVVADEKGVRTRVAEKLDLDFLYSVCCRDTPDNHVVECVYGRFDDQRLTIWCHEEGRLVPLPVLAVTTHGEDFCGPLVVTSSRDTEEGVDMDWLDDAQVQQVLTTLLPAVGVQATEPSFRVTTVERTPCS